MYHRTCRDVESNRFPIRYALIIPDGFAIERQKEVEIGQNVATCIIRPRGGNLCGW